MTYRLAIISDLHADLHALDDALGHIDALGCDAIVCAGDIVDYGKFPNETIARLVERRIPTIRGNHDRWALAPDRRDSTALSEESKQWLAELPLKWEAHIEGARVAVHHGRPPRSDMDPVLPDELRLEEAKRLLDAADADVLVVGHSHIPFAVEIVGRGWIVNPGALLRDPAPVADHPPATGTFGVFEFPAMTFRVFDCGTGAESEIIRRSIVW